MNEMDERRKNYPESKSCPRRILTLGSLQPMDPNLMYADSFASLKIGFVDLSK